MPTRTLGFDRVSFRSGTRDASRIPAGFRNWRRNVFSNPAAGLTSGQKPKHRLARIPHRRALHLKISSSTLFEPFLGRREELAALTERFRVAKTSQSGATVVISGEAGIGKSRLLREFIDTVRKERCLVLNGACFEYLTTPFAPFVDALADDPAAAHLEAELRNVDSHRAADADIERRRRFELVENHLRRRAIAIGSLLVAIEDLHWSDAASTDLLRFLAARLRDAPVLLILTYRSDDVTADRSPLVSSLVRGGAVSIQLDPLSERHITELIQSVTTRRAGVSDAELRRIAELSEGRPLAAEELLRVAVDGTVPVSIRSGVLERLRTFDEAGQVVLCSAAVIGRSFDVAMLERVTEKPAATILSTLRRARNLQLIVEENHSLMRFRHAITREVLYSELLTAEVRPQHNRIAHALEAENPPRLDEAAYHWSAAGDAGRAIDANEATGDRAAAMYAYADAARAYERAMPFAAGTRRAQLIEKLAFALCAIGSMDAARAWCEDGAAVLAKLDRGDAAKRLMLWVARQLYESGHVERAFQTIESVRATLGNASASPVRAAADTTLAAMLATVGRAAEALDLTATLDARACEGDPVDGFRLHNARGIALCSLARYAEAQASYSRAAALPGISDELRLYAKLNGGNASLHYGDTDAAAQAYEDARALADGGGLQRHQAMVASSLALVALYRGDLANALARYVAVIESTSAVAMTKGFAQAVGIRLLGLLGQNAALADLDVMQAVDGAFRLRESQTIAIVCGAAAQLLLERGDSGAGTIVRRALSVVTVPDYAYWLCDAAAAVGDDALARQARDLLVRATANETNRPATAHLRLFDARRTPAGPARSSAAREAGFALESIGWPLEAAAAFTVAQDPSRAHALYARCGVAREPAASDGYAFSPRERDVAHLAVRGFTSREIGEALHIGERTVETHLRNVFRKTGVRTRIELASRLR